MRLTRRSCLLGLPPALVHAQNDAEPLKFSVDVQLVSVAFLVRDKQGRLVPKLEKDHFSVFESGQAQQIRHFLREEQTPLNIALVIDRSGSQDTFEQENIYAAVTFFRSVLRPQDKALVSAFGNRIKLVSPLTSSLDELERSLRRMSSDYDRLPTLGGEVKRSGGSAVLDAAYHTARRELADLEGRKAVIMIGDGRDNASKVTMVDLLDLLQNRDILFYGLDNGGEDTTANRRLRNSMTLLAAESGGRVFDTNETTLRDSFDQIEAELRTLYSLGYASTNTERDGRYRRIEIRSADSAHKVRHRPGYYAR
jgi:Ca-activated chloride channel homolog